MDHPRGFFEAILETVKDGVWVTDGEDRIVFFNPNMERIAGDSADQMVGLSVVDDFSEEATGDLLRFYQRAKKTLFPIDYEVNAVTPAGRRTIQAGRLTPRLEDGRFAGMICTVQDVTESRRKQKALLSEGDRAQRYLDIAPAMILSLDTAGCITLLNSEGSRILGCDEEDPTGLDWFSNFLPEDSRQIVRQAFRSFMDGDLDGAEDYENYIQTRSGDLRQIRWHNTVLRDEEGRISGVLSSGQDVTAARRTEADLRETRENLSALFGAMSEMVVLHELVLDEDGAPCNYRIIDCNPAFTSVTGIARDDAVGGLATEVYHQDSPPYFDKYSKVALTGKPMEFEEYYEPMGKHFRISVVCPSKNHFATVTTDVTASRERERYLETILQTTADGFWVVDLDQRICKVNEAYCAMSGYSRDEVLGMRIADIDLDEESEQVRERTKRIILSGSEIFEVRHRRKDGSVLPLEVATTYMPQRGGQIVCFYRDLTERLNAEKALRESRAMLHLVLDTIPQSVFWKDVEGRYLGCNKAFAADVGIKAPSEIVGKTDFDLPWPKEEAEAYRADDREVVQSGRAKLHIEERGQRADGAGIWADTCKAPLRDEAGNCFGVLGVYLDITERKKAEAALAETKALLQAAMDNSPAGIAIADAPDGKLRYVNEAGLLIRGGSVEEIVDGVGVDQYVSTWRILDLDGTPLDQDEIPLVRALLYGEKCSREFIVRRSDEEDRIVWANAAPIENEAGQVVSAMVVFLDATESKQAEQALRESEERFRTLIESAPMSILMLRDGKYIYANPESARLLGRQASDELVGRSAMDAIAPEFHDAVRERVRNAASGGTNPPLEIQVVRPGGSRIWCLSQSVSVVYEGQATEVIVWQDVQTRKDTELALRKSEELYRLLAENATDCIWRLSLDTVFEYVNPACEAILGYTPDEMIGKPLRNFCDEDNFQIIYREIAAAIQNPQKFSLSVFTARMMRKSGEHVPVEITGKFLYAENGSPTGLQGVTRDISERIRAEEEQESLQSQLAQAQKMESVGRLAGGVAHDFNNMLNVILGHTEIAIDELPDASPLRDGLQEIQKAGQRSANLTRQLLGFARKQTMAPEVLDLSECVSDLLKMLRRLIGEDIDLLWKPCSQPASVLMDPSQVDQILANLCVNARDAIGHSVGKITIDTHRVGVDEEYCRTNTGAVPGDYVMLTVSDDGCGMDEETREKIFEPFYTTKELGEGTGLGLATVYGIVKQNRGFVNVYSEPGQGTTFKIYLPVHAEKGQKTPGEEDAGRVGLARGNETILLVEDEKPLLALSKAILKRAGYDILTASTPGEALALAREHSGRIDLLVTDVVMPEMNGRDLARSILKVYPDIKRLFMSGYTANVIAHQGVLDPGVNFIQKPFSPTDFCAQVRRALDAE